MFSYACGQKRTVIVVVGTFKQTRQVLFNFECEPILAHWICEPIVRTSCGLPYPPHLYVYTVAENGIGKLGLSCRKRPYGSRHTLGQHALEVAW